MSPPITFSQWMDKLCENKFLGSNSASPSSFKASPKVSPKVDTRCDICGWDMRRPFRRQLCGSVYHTYILYRGIFICFFRDIPILSLKVPLDAAQKAGKVWLGWHMRRPFERQLWTCLWGAAAFLDQSMAKQKQKTKNNRNTVITYNINASVYAFQDGW